MPDVQPNPLKQQRDNLAKQIASAAAGGKEDVIKKLRPNYFAIRQKLKAQEKATASKAVANASKNPKEVANIADEVTGEEEPSESNEESINKNMKMSKDKFGGKKPHKWSPSCDCPSCQAEYAKQNEKRRKKGLSHESTNIANFLKAISQKNYAQADKYLQSTVESKLRAAINNAVQNSK
jgi:predicted RND superfamily exporter protein